jgi:hypothetical protein
VSDGDKARGNAGE